MDKDEIKNETETKETPIETTDKAEEYLNNWKKVG